MAIFFIILFGIIQFSHAADEGYSYSDFKNTILRADVQTIPETLSRLPIEMRANYTLVHSSKSLQGSSYLMPRALLFGNTGNLILAFNGDPETYGFNSMETASFNAATQKIEFRKIIFRAESPANLSWNLRSVAGSENLNADQEIEFFDNRILISKPNPQMCMNCHAAERTSSVFSPKGLAKYNWSAYNTWPDAYGTNDDTNSNNSSDLALFRKYQQNAINHPRYQKLVTDPNNQAFPYYPAQDQRTLSRMPNTRLLYLMMIRYGQQTAIELANSTWFQSHPYQVMLALMDSTYDHAILTTPPHFVELKENDGRFYWAGKMIDSAFSRLTLSFDFTTDSYSSYFHIPSGILLFEGMQDVVRGLLVNRFKETDPEMITIIQGQNNDPLYDSVLKEIDPVFLQFMTDHYFFKAETSPRSRQQQLLDYLKLK